MSERKSRREFVGGAALGVVVVALGGKVAEGQAGTQTSPSTGATPGAPPAFGTSPAVGPEEGSGGGARELAAIDGGAG
jgi:hypothetical protein